MPLSHIPQPCGAPALIILTRPGILCGIPDGVILIVSPGAYIVLSSVMDGFSADIVNGIIEKAIINAMIAENTHFFNIKFLLVCVLI